jgi:multiple sugar transport system ATP-binding protein
MVFQSYALYPQMTVEKNLSFGLQVARCRRRRSRSASSAPRKSCRSSRCCSASPSELSGGQRQRVAIGRALVRDVDVFLFDEPLSNLDAKLRNDLRIEIKRLHARLKNTMIYVTHDQIEAMTLADRIAIMKNGVIQQLADPHTIYNKPVNLFVAGFIGSPSMNFIKGDLAGTTLSVEGQAIPLATYQFANQTNGASILGIRPEHIAVGEEARKMPVQMESEIEIVEPMGADTVAWTKIAGQSLTFRAAAEVHLEPGQKVLIGFDPGRGSVFNAASGNRI